MEMMKNGRVIVIMRAGMLFTIGAASIVTSAKAQQVVDVTTADRHLAGDFEEVYRIGGSSSVGWEALGVVRALGFDGDGRLYVADPTIPGVVVVDRDGELLAEFGRSGEGPGEFSIMGDMVVGTDGVTAIADLGRAVLQVFSPRGHFLRTVKMDSLAIARAHDLVGVGRGDVILSFRDAPGQRIVDRVFLEGSEVKRMELVRTWRPPQENGTNVDMTIRISLRSVEMAPVEAFFPGLILEGRIGGGAMIVDSSAYAIKVVESDGSISRVLRRPNILPQKVTRELESAERERRRQEAEDRWQGLMAFQKVQIRGIRQMRFFEEVPVIRDLKVTWGDNVWVQRRGAEPWDDLGPIDVLSHDGRYIGTFDPSSTSIPNAFGPDGLAAFVEGDELEVPVVIVRRLPLELR